MMGQRDAFRCELSSQQVAALAHVSYRQLDYWIRSRLLPQPMVPADGKGTERRFSFLDLLRARVVARLRHEGASLQAIRRALDVLENEWNVKNPLETGRLVAIDGRVCLEADREMLWDILRGQGMAKRIVTLDVSELARDTVAQVRALQAA